MRRMPNALSHSLHLQQCNQAMCNVQRVFAMLRIGLHAREADIMRELQSVRQTASLILQRRKATAICLRKLSENATRLEDSQVQELKRQLKVMMMGVSLWGALCQQEG